MEATVTSAAKTTCIPLLSDGVVNIEGRQAKEHGQQKQDYVAVLSGSKYRTPKEIFLHATRNCTVKLSATEVAVTKLHMASKRFRQIPGAQIGLSVSI